MAIESGLFRVSKKHKAIVIPFTPAVSATIPHAEVIDHKGAKFQLIPHKYAETKMLNNLHIAAPPAILHHYDWCGTTPFDAQRETAALMTTNRRAYVLNDMGTGKTRASLYATDFLMKCGDGNKCLVVAPLSTLTSVWEKEIFQCFSHRRAIVLHGTKQKRLASLEEDSDYYIINHDGLRVMEDALRERDDIDMVIIDELAVLRNSKSKRWKVTNRIVSGKTWVWGLTGSPTPKEPTDAYGQAKLLTPHTVPKYFTPFKNMVMTQVSQFRWIPKPDANDIVHKVLQPAVRFTLDDCVDLPETTYSTREVPMTPEQTKAYKQMMQEYVVEYEAGKITAANAGVRTNKLIQIGAGFTYSENGDAIEVPHKPRLDALREIIDETSRKLIVFAPFKYTVEELYDELKDYVSTGMIHGDVAKAERDKLFTRFQNGVAPRVLIAHPQTMAHGLTLTAANTIVWYSPLPNLEIYEQACARIARPGQKHHTHIIHLESSPTERRIYKVLEKRGNMQAELLKMFRK